MMLFDAYKKAIELPIKDINNVTLRRSGGREPLYLRLLQEKSVISLGTPDDMDHEDERFSVSLDDIMSDDWEVFVSLDK